MEREPEVEAAGVVPTNQFTQSADSHSRCPYARIGLIFYRGRFTHWQLQRGADLPLWRKPRNCADARYLAYVWAKRSLRSRRQTERWLENLETDSATAICHIFGPYCSQALRVASCESGWSMTPRARNGQYLGIFQMGSYARSKYGHGEDRLTQVRAAYHYFLDSGSDWSPWSCRP